MLLRASRPIFIPLLLDYARAEGVDTDEQLRLLGISPDIEGQSEVVIELAKVNALIDAIATTLGDPFLGIHVAVRYRRGTYQLLEFACRNSPDLRGAIVRLVRYAALVNPAMAFSFVEVASGGALSQRFAGAGRHANEFAVAVLYLLGREITRKAWTPDAVWFAHEAPADTGGLVSLFGTSRIRFGEESSGLSIGCEVLAEPISGADPALLRVLEIEIQRQAPPAAPPPTLQIVADTERAVRSTLELGAPRIENVAQALGIAARTLQRRLNDEGTTFQKVVEETRERLARHHVQRGELSSVQIAFVLGYADVSAFHRAFKRWTGTTPLEFRNAAEGSVRRIE